MRPTSQPTIARRAFSLLELLVVIAIIALLIGILVPALGGARTSAKTTATRAMMQDFTNAVSQFGLDNSGRNPGLFTQAELGSVDNADAGLSAMENALLDLMGAEAVVGRVSDVNAGVVSLPSGVQVSDLIQVGVDTADNTKKYYLNPALLGTGKGAYFTPDTKYLAQARNEGNGTPFGQFSASPRTGAGQQFAVTGADNLQTMPDLVDAFGTPVLLWAADEFGPSRVRLDSAANALDDFVRDEYASSGQRRSAAFYLNANKAFLAATGLGTKGVDQTATSGPRSLIGTRNGTFNQEARENLAALLASPGSYGVLDNGDLAGADINEIFPIAPRSSLIVHAAGADGFYFGSEDPGFKRATVDGSTVAFGLTYKINDTTLRNTDGAATSYDLTSGFDDILVTGK